MSGHSKWSTIKRKKEARDKQRGSVFTKMANMIVVAVKKGGSGDPERNFSLRLAIDKARMANMPSSNIKRAISRGEGASAGSFLDEIVLEGYGPSSVPVIVEVVTDNRNRTVAELKTIFDKAGGSLAEPGAVMYQFERVGRVGYKGKIDDELFLELIDLGASDLDQDAGDGAVYCSLDSVSKIAEALSKKGMVSVSVEMIYKFRGDSQSGGDVRSKFLDQLREHDDVQGVFSNVIA